MEEKIVSRLRLFTATLITLTLALIGCSSCIQTDQDTSIDAGVVFDVPDAEPEPEPEPSPITWEDCGGRVGDHACDFTFPDQLGDDWNLYDHYGDVIVLDFSTMWCYYCKVSAAGVEAQQVLHQADGFIWVTVLIDDVSGDEVSIDEALLWATEYGINTAPVLAGDRSIIDLSAEDGYPLSSWPTFVLVDRDMTIAYGLHGWNETTLDQWIQELLAE